MNDYFLLEQQGEKRFIKMQFSSKESLINYLNKDSDPKRYTVIKGQGQILNYEITVEQPVMCAGGK